MAFRLNVGQYFDAPSPIHAMDARVKLCCALAGMVGPPLNCCWAPPSRWPQLPPAASPWGAWPPA